MLGEVKSAPKATSRVTAMVYVDVVIPSEAVTKTVMVLAPIFNGRGALFALDVTGVQFTVTVAAVSVTVGLIVMALVVTETL